MGTNYAPLVVDLVLFCYERDFLLSFSGDKGTEIIETFNLTSRCLHGLFITNNTFLTAGSIKFTHQNIN